MGNFNFSSAREALRLNSEKIHQKWAIDPSKSKGGPSVKMGEDLIRRFYASARRTNFSDHLSSNDVATALQIINEVKSRTWNPSCVEHSIQVGILARTIGEDSATCLSDSSDPNWLETAGLLHDLGRCVSHDPWLHGIAGKHLLLSLGFSPKIAEIAYLHLEAGAPLLGATPENWGKILAADNLDSEVEKLALPEVIIAVADMAKENNRLCDPMRGVFASGLRRLNQKQAKVISEAISDIKISVLGSEKQYLKDIYKINRRMGMYLGLCWLFKQRLIEEGVDFKGEDGVIAKAEKTLEKMQVASSPGS